MNDQKIKSKVRDFRREYHIQTPSLASITSIFERQGFTVIQYNPVLNDENVSIIVENLNLADLVASTNGFLYVDNNYRLVFVNERLSEDEKLLVMLHEEGHYYFGHTSAKAHVGQSVIEEYEANRFADILLRKPILGQMAEFALRYKRVILFIAIVFIIVIGSISIARFYHIRNLYEGEYYVTMNGEKYHLKQCITIQGHNIRRLTKEDILSGKYDPCRICIPDEK